MFGLFLTFLQKFDFFFQVETIVIIRCSITLPIFQSALEFPHQTLFWRPPWFLIKHYLCFKVYSFIKSQVTYRTSLQSKYRLYEIRPTGTARRLATRWVREWPCKQINMQRKLQLNTISFLRWRHICHVSFWCWWESIPGSLAWEARYRLGGEIVSHNTTDARQTSRTLLYSLCMCDVQGHGR